MLHAGTYRTRSDYKEWYFNHSIEHLKYGGAYARFKESKKGAVKEGKLADFVILTEDPAMIKPDAINNIKVFPCRRCTCFRR